MSGAFALAYLEARMAVNRFRQVLHQPGRLALWALFLAWIGLFFFTRSERAAGGIPFGLLLPQSVHLLRAFVPAAYIILIGFEIYAGSRRPPAAFTYPADARFLFGSRINPVLVIFWLQLREVAFSGSRVFLGVFFVSWNFAGSAGGLVNATVALLCAYVIAFGLRLPVFLAQRRMPEIPFGVFGIALIGAGVLSLLFPVALGFVSGSAYLSYISAQTALFPPGSWILAALAGDTSALFALLAVAAVVVAGGSLAAKDAYPELWEASSRLYALRALIASGRGLWNQEEVRALRDAERSSSPVRYERMASSSGVAVPSGATAIFWKDWLALRRAPGGLGGPLLWLAGGCAVGYLAGLAARSFSPLLLLGPVIAIANIFIVIGSQSTINLGSELRKPIWWLATTPFRGRVMAWIAGTTLRIAPSLCAGAIVAAVVMHSWTVALVAPPVIVIALLLVQSIGVASYVVLPGRNDLRGPGFMLRLLVTYVALLPPAVVWAIAQLASQSVVAGVLSALVVASFEAWMLISFAAARLERSPMEYAAAEQR
jgi:hypothetical protein